MLVTLSHSIASSLLLAAHTSALAGSLPGKSLTFICPSGANELCSALHKELVQLSGSDLPLILASDQFKPSGDIPSVQFVLEINGPDAVAGHLEWSLPDGSSGIGRSLELSISDANLTSDMLRDFAARLVKSSKVPL